MADGTNVGSIYYTTTLDTQGLIDGEREARRAMGRMESAGQGLERTLTKVGGALAAMFTAGAIVAGMRAMADASGRFELALDNLQAITGITGDRLKAVEQAAMNFGKTTSTSASEAVDAMKLIASAKGELADNEQSLIAVTKAAQTLAEASGMALPAAADSLVTALNQMGVGASQAERYINVMAAGAKVGASEVAESSAALKDFATTAASVGVSFEAANAAIQGLAKAGIKGSEAGNALRNVMLKLETDADSKLKPSLHGLTGSIEALGQKNLSTAALTKMFGLENINAAKALIANTATIKQFEAAMTGTNTAYEQAAINSDNYATSVKKMHAAMDAAAITVGAMLTPALQAGADAVTSIAVEVAEGSDRINTMLKLMETAAVIAAGALAGPLVTALAAAAIRATATAGAIGAAGLAVKAFNVAMAGLGGPIGIAITALSLLVLNWDHIVGSAETAAQVSERSADRIAAALKKSQTSADRDLIGQEAEQVKKLAEVQANIDRLQKSSGKGLYGTKADPSVMQGYLDQRDAYVKSLQDIKAARDKLGGGGGRGSVNPAEVTPAPEAGQSPVDTEADERAAKGAKYLSDLRAKATTDGLAKIAMAEQAALSDNAAMLAKGEINAATSEQAKALIRQQFAADRKALVEKELQDEAGARIAVTIDAESRVAAIRDEAIRRTNAAEKAGTLTAVAASRERALAVFDAERSLADLREKDTQAEAEMRVRIAVSEQERIELSHAESIRRINAAEQAGTLSRVQAERERTLAAFDADRTRAELAERNTRARAGAEIAITRSASQQIMLIRDEEIRQAEEGYRRGAMTFEEAEASKARAVMDGLARQQQLQSSRSQAQISTLQIKAETTDDPRAKEELIRAQAAAQIEAVEQARIADLDASQIYADQKVAIEAKMNEDIRNLRANAAAAEMSRASSTFAGLAGIMKSAAGEQSGIYKAMFAASKAFAIAESIIKIQQGIASAAALPFPLNFPAMASVAAATTGIVQTITGTNYGGGRQYGGPVSADSMYRVNETGRPEMFTAANGNQFMLPTSSGRVTPADQVGTGGVQWQIIVNNTAPGAAASASVDNASRTVTIAVREVASQISERRGEVWGAMRTTNVQGRPG